MGSRGSHLEIEGMCGCGAAAAAATTTPASTLAAETCLYGGKTGRQPVAAVELTLRSAHEFLCAPEDPNQYVASMALEDSWPPNCRLRCQIVVCPELGEGFQCRGQLEGQRGELNCRSRTCSHGAHGYHAYSTD